MRCSLALACLAGCSFSTNVDNNRDGVVVDGAPDAPPDAPPDAFVGSEAPVTSMMTFTSAGDIYLRTSLAPNENTNSLDYVIVDGDNIATALVRFDTSAIPTTAVVMTAEMTLYVDGDPGSAVSIYPMLESWDEATATQAVYLYTQVAQNYSGDANAFFDTVRHPLNQSDAETTWRSALPSRPSE